MLRFIEHFFCGSRYWFSGTKICGCFGRLVTVTAATERLLKALRGDSLWKIYGYLLRVKQVLPYGLI